MPCRRGCDAALSLRDHVFALFNLPVSLAQTKEYSYQSFETTDTAGRIPELSDEDIASTCRLKNSRQGPRIAHNRATNRSSSASTQQTSQHVNHHNYHGHDSRSTPYTNRHNSPSHRLTPTSHLQALLILNPPRLSEIQPLANYLCQRQLHHNHHRPENLRRNRRRGGRLSRPLPPSRPRSDLEATG